MLQLFRNFFKSKIGVGITLAFLVVIAIAFASSDLANTSLGGGVAADDRVAVVGDERISASDLSTAASNALEQARQSNPTITMQAFIAQGGLDQTLEGLLGRTVLAEFARANGLRAGKRLVDSELAQIPAFQGPDGQFSAEAFNALLSQRGLTEAAVREDFAGTLLSRQLLLPVASAPTIPQSFATRYATLLRERREGAIALLPSALFAPEGDPTQEQLQAYYQETRNNYVRPERRVIRYATFGPEALDALPAPTDAQIAERFQRDRANYAAKESRTFTQLVLPTEAAANAVVAEVRAGKSLAAAAQEKGLQTGSIGPIERQAFATASSAEVAQAGFAAAEGALTAPVRGSLGWYVLQVDEIDRQPARTLAQVRDEIAATLATEQRAQALSDLTARIEEEFDEGTSLADIARELDLTLSQTAPATADGGIYQRSGETVPQVLGRVLGAAFEMEEGEPQLAEVVPGQQFIVFDVPEVTASAVAPLAEIREDVVALWRQAQGAKAAKAAADAVVARMAKGASLAEAVRAVKPNAPAPERLALGREDLARQGRVPPQMALFFSMAEGTTKKLEAAQDSGWFVVRLDDIEPGKVEANDPLVRATLSQLATVASEEYMAQFARAAQNEVGVERNEEAIQALAAQLSGQGG